MRNTRTKKNKRWDIC